MAGSTASSTEAETSQARTYSCHSRDLGRFRACLQTYSSLTGALCKQLSHFERGSDLRFCLCSESQVDVEPRNALMTRCGSGTRLLLDVATLAGLRIMNRLRKTALFPTMCLGRPGTWSRVPPKTCEMSKCLKAPTPERMLSLALGQSFGSSLEHGHRVGVRPSISGSFALLECRSLRSSWVYLPTPRAEARALVLEARRLAFRL